MPLVCSRVIVGRETGCCSTSTIRSFLFLGVSVFCRGLGTREKASRVPRQGGCGGSRSVITAVTIQRPMWPGSVRRGWGNDGSTVQVRRLPPPAAARKPPPGADGEQAHGSYTPRSPLVGRPSHLQSVTGAAWDLRTPCPDQRPPEVGKPPCLPHDHPAQPSTSGTTQLVPRPSPVTHRSSRFWFQTDVTGGQPFGRTRQRCWSFPTLPGAGCPWERFWVRTWRYGLGARPGPPRRSLVSTCLGEVPLRLLPVP